MAGIKKYFELHARQWIADSYRDDGYNYPVAFHRARIVSKFVSGLDRSKLKIIDLGCGGGDVTFNLARDGHEVLGIDRSREMINLARARRASLPRRIQSRVRFLRGAIESVNSGKKFDVAVAMGLVGYLPDDEILFNAANKLLKPKGYFLVSCRNRLFNMNSISFRTKKEIKNGEAVRLIAELEKLYTRIPAKDADAFVKDLKKIAKDLPPKTSFNKKLTLSASEKYCPDTTTLNREPRQNTPQQLQKTASKCGFRHKAYFGVHPHLMDPNANKAFPPQLFNKISSSLEALEHLPISLVWSSVFIGAFQKIK